MQFTKIKRQFIHNAILKLLQVVTLMSWHRVKVRYIFKLTKNPTYSFHIFSTEIYCLFLQVDCTITIDK